MRTPILLVAALSFALTAACGGGADTTEQEDVGGTTGGAQSSGGDAASAPDVDGAAAQALVADGAFLLDVTPAPRNEESELPGRTNIPLPELADRMDEVPRDRPVVVYCFGGRGSPRAAEMLRDAGYADVHLLGAMSNWESNAGAAQSCAGYSLGDSCIDEDNFAQCQAMEAQCPGEVLAMESCPLQFACPE